MKKSKTVKKIKEISIIEWWKCTKGDCYYSGLVSCPEHGYIFMRKLNKSEMINPPIYH